MRTRSIDVYVGLFLISVSTLLLEILQMRVLSIITFAGFVYIIITFALLGFGISGALLAVLPALRRSDYRPLLSKLCVCYALSILVGVFFAGRFPGRFPIAPIQRLVREPAYLLGFFLNGIFFATPFVFSGLCIGRVLMDREERINVLYFLNLAGSGIGCALFPLAVSALGGPGAVMCAAAIGVLAGAFFLRRQKARAFAPLVGLSCALVAVGAIAGDKILRIDAGPDKELSFCQDKERYPDAEVEWNFWSTVCRTDVIGSTHYAAELPDESKVPRKVVTIDGGAMTWMWGGLTAAQKEACAKDYEFMRSFRMLAYLTKKNPDVLLIGVGGGNDVLNAELQEANSITGIDINEGVIRAVKGKYRNFTGGLYTDGPARILVGEGRNFVRHTDRKFDIIHMHGVDTFAALASGAYLFAENYLYTVEAFEDYLTHLNDDGILSATRFSLYPPRETLRLFSTALDALETLGAADAFRHVIILGAPGRGIWATLLCKRSAFTDDEIAQYEELCQRIPYVRYWIPDSSMTRPKLRDGRQNFYHAFHQSVREGKREEFVGSYTYEVTSTTDDRPFFYKSFRYRDVLHPRRSSLGTIGPFGSWGLLGLMVFGTEALVGIVALIFFPLLKFRRDGLRVKGAGRYATYFCCLGVGFILIEITLMQRLSLFLGHPTYSISVVLFCLLVFSGLGSLFSGSLAVRPAAVVKWSVPLLALTALLLNFIVLPSVTHLSLGFSLPVRVVITALLIAPLAFMMGMPFPSGLRIVKENELVQFIPWAWGVNGAASVLGSVASIVLAMTIGFSALTALAVLIYLLGMIVLFWRRLPIAPSEPGST